MMGVLSRITTFYPYSGGVNSKRIKHIFRCRKNLLGFVFGFHHFIKLLGNGAGLNSPSKGVSQSLVIAAINLLLFLLFFFFYHLQVFACCFLSSLSLPHRNPPADEIGFQIPDFQFFIMKERCCQYGIRLPRQISAS